MKTVQNILLIVVLAVLLVCVWVVLNPQTSLADNPWNSRHITYNNGASVDSLISELTLDTVFTVNSIGDAADSNPGNGDCDDGAGNCTLRAAIEESNALSGMDTIAFDIEGEGPHTIQPASALPVVTDPVIIDGTTEPDYVDSPIIELFGNDMIDGLVVEAGNSTIRGLVINRFDDGIILKINGGNFIEGNYIGIDVSGTTEYHNTRGVYVDGSNNNTIGGTSLAKRNIISGNYGQIEIAFADNNLVQGNYIGTDVTGTEIFTYGGGISIAEGSNNTIGGTVANAGNLISGNRTGIEVHTEDNIKIQGNLIGTDKTGTIPLGNSRGIRIYVSTGIIGGTEVGARNIISGNGYGIYGEVENTPIQGNYIGTDINGTTAVGNNNGLDVASALIGGTDPGAGNVISGNDGDGIILKWDNIVKGNIIGLDASGTAVLSNGGSGFWVRYDNNLIGGPEPGAGNVISGNQIHGIDLDGDGNIVQGNYIGTDITSENIIGNNSYGIVIGGNNNLVGGSTIEHGNIIKGHSGGGIRLPSDQPINNMIRANSIFGNRLVSGGNACDSLGIDLGCGVTLNDPGDADEGANHLQNFPVLIPSIDASILFSGTLNSTSSTTFNLDFYSNSSCGLSQYGEGEHYLGAIEVTTDGAGNADFQIEELDVFPKGHFLTATATDPENNTSEFSLCVFNNHPPSISGTQSGQHVNDTDTIDPFTEVIIADPDDETLTVIVSLDNTAKGNLTNLGGFVEGPSGTYTFVGSPSSVTTAIQGLTFNPTENRKTPGGTDTTIFTISADDGIADPVTDDTTTVIATSINDPPTITGTVAGQTVDDNDNIPPFTGVNIADPDKNTTLTVIVSLDDPDKGDLTNLGGFLESPAGTYTFTGSPTASTTAIQGLIFYPTIGRVPVGQTETTTFTISADDGYAAPVTDDTTTVITTAVEEPNTPPSISGTVADQPVDDNATIGPFSAVTISDPDTATITVTVSLDDSAKGDLINLGGFVEGPPGTYTFTGSPAEASSAIRALTFDPTEDRVPVGQTETTTFIISADDGVANPVTDDTTTVIVTAVEETYIIYLPLIMR